MSDTKTFENSSTVERMRYLRDQSIMEVTFTTGKVYRYFGLDNEMWEKAIKAESIGQFLNQNIKGKYKYQLMN